MELDRKVIEGFGEEWQAFDQTQLPDEALQDLFEGYFSVFPWEKMSSHSIGFDLGCGSGRWAKFVAPRVGTLWCIEPSEKALNVARKNLAHLPNVNYVQGTIQAFPMENETADFGYSLGVLHHVSETEQTLRLCVKKLKVGAPFLVYLYHDFELFPGWYRTIWTWSETIRFVLSRAPFKIRYFLSQIIAGLVYYPLARFSWVLEKCGAEVRSVPLSFYRNKPFYLMRTDALDRFGTRLEKRYSREEITQLMIRSGLENILFSEKAPFWCAVGYKK